MNPAEISSRLRRSPIHGSRESSVKADAGPASFLGQARHRPTSGVTMTDRSLRRRFGVKGPAAEAWLAERGFPIPLGANRWTVGGDALVGRLATSEFLIESLAEDEPRVILAAEQLAAASRPAQVFPVVRQDLVVSLKGPALSDLLRQICGVNFTPHLREPDSASGTLVLTSMIGVGAVAVPRLEADGVDLTLWLDPSFANYFWTTLTALISDLEGGEPLEQPNRT